MKLRYGEGTIDIRERRDGSASYRVRWYGLDGKRRTKTFPSQDAAQAHLLEVSGQKRQRKYRDPATMTVAEAAEEWLERGWRRWRGGTGATYEYRMETHVLPAWGDVAVAAITPHRMQSWIDTLTLAPSTISGIISMLSGMMRECVRLGVIDRNPMTDVRGPKQRESPLQVWNGDDVRRVLASLPNDRWRSVYHIMLSTGMRPGEMRALRWEDISFDRATVTVRRTVAKVAGAAVVRESTKSGRSRVVPLTLPCLAALQAWQEASPSPWVASVKDDPLHDVTWREWHKRMCRRVGVPVIGLHAMRHTAATLLLERGVHPKVIAEMLGHSSISVTLDIYAHANVDMQRAAMASLTDVFGVAYDNSNDVSGVKIGENAGDGTIDRTTG